MYIRLLDNRPTIIEPINDPIIPINVIPPDNPCETFSNEIIEIGFTLESFPNSVAQVSAIAVATEAANK